MSFDFDLGDIDIPDFDESLIDLEALFDYLLSIEDELVAVTNNLTAMYGFDLNLVTPALIDYLEIALVDTGILNADGAAALTLAGGLIETGRIDLNAAWIVAHGSPPDSGSFQLDDLLYVLTQAGLQYNNGTELGDIMIGNDDGNVFFGRGGDDPIFAFGGDDLIYGNQGDDLIYGNQGSDDIYGGQGIDVIFGGQDADLIYGNLHSDIIYGNFGDDVIYGGQDIDILFGGQGDDWLYGNLGDDLLIGNLGNDILAGGPGQDSFLFASNSGIDLITDFDPDHDSLLIAADANDSGIQTGADALARLSDGAGGALLDLGDGNLVTLAGLAAGDLGADDFIIF